MSALVIHISPLRKSAPPIDSCQTPAQIWERIQDDARGIIKSETSLARLLTSGILIWPSLTLAVSHRIATRLADRNLSASLLGKLFDDAFRQNASLLASLVADLRDLADRHGEARSLVETLLYCKTFHALQAHRLAHILWQQGRQDLALLLQSRISAVFQSNLHPSRQFVLDDLIIARAV